MKSIKNTRKQVGPTQSQTPFSSAFWVKKKLNLKKNKALKCFWSKKNLGSKKYLVQKIPGSKSFSVQKYFGLKICGPKNFCVRKIFLIKNTFSPTKFWVQQNFGSKIILGPKKF